MRDKSDYLHRKYRPSNFNEIVGQKNITETLIRSVKNGKFGQAYFFLGGKGTGKTTTARVFANSINCENYNKEKGVCCGNCNSCNKVPNGSSPDVIELDAASNRGIDNIKKIIEDAVWPPTELKYKIYIIDEAHQLTPEAINALLKILEEPPPYLKFILCTTESKKSKAFETLLSRCLRFTFTILSNKTISCHLEKVASKENIDIEKEALIEIADMARGSMRDALIYLDQIKSLDLNKKITLKNIESYYNLASRNYIYKMAESIFDADIANLLTMINELLVASVSIDEIVSKITDVFRNVLITKVVGDDDILIKKVTNLNDNDVQLIKALTNKVDDVNKLVNLPKEFSDLTNNKTININDRWILEATLIRCAKKFV
jgi:DNA polymerase-3 subunit gamma/tau